MQTQSEEASALTHFFVALAIGAGLSIFGSVALDYPALPAFGLSSFVAALLSSGLGYYIFHSLVWTAILSVAFRLIPYALKAFA